MLSPELAVEASAGYQLQLTDEKTEGETLGRSHPAEAGVSSAFPGRCFVQLPIRSGGAGLLGGGRGLGFRWGGAVATGAGHPEASG